MKQQLVLPAGTRSDRWNEIRQTLLEQVWKGLLVVALLGAPASASRALFTGWQQLYTVHVVLALVIVVTYMCRTRIPFSIRAAISVLTVYSIGAAGLLMFGLISVGLWWLLLGSLLGSVLYSLRFGILLAVLTLGIVAVAGIGFVGGFITVSFNTNVYLSQASTWVTVLLGGALTPLILFHAIAAYQNTVFELLKEVEQQHDQQAVLNTQLREALADVKTLQGLIPICSKCKKIRDDTGYWEHVEAYVQKHTDAAFTHGLCPTCGEQLYGELWTTTMKRMKSDAEELEKG
jgi:hypothetical protein